MRRESVEREHHHGMPSAIGVTDNPRYVVLPDLVHGEGGGHHDCGDVHAVWTKHDPRRVVLPCGRVAPHP